VQRVAWDVKNEYISKQDAERTYGVVFKERSTEPDMDATAKLRAR